MNTQTSGSHQRYFTAIRGMSGKGGPVFSSEKTSCWRKTLAGGFLFLKKYDILAVSSLFFYTYIEAGKQDNPTIDTLKKVAKALSVPIEDLIN